MILINLLPHREERRERRKKAFFTGLGLSAALGVALLAGGWGLLQGMKSNQESRNSFLKEKTAELDKQIASIKTLREEIDSLRARQKAVEDLQADRNMPVYLLNELVRQTPEGVFLSSIQQDGQRVVISGLAQSNERVSEFLRNLTYSSPWLKYDTLQEIKSDIKQVENSKEQKRLSNFSLALTVKRPEDAAAELDKAASAAAAAASAAGPAVSPTPVASGVKEGA